MSSTVTTALDTTTRTEILDVVTRFCRGVDRHDRTLLESCYHPGAIDRHGVYDGPAEGFIDWVIGATAGIPFLQHSITNHAIVAASEGVVVAETYYHARTNGTDGALAQAFGRYIDRFELRDGQWRIAERLCTMEYASPNMGYDLAMFDNGSPDETDASYAFVRALNG